MRMLRNGGTAFSFALRLVHQRWFQILCAGVVLFFGAEQALKITGNLNLVPTVMLLGAFAVPVTYVAYFSGRESKIDRGVHVLSVPLIATCFLAGGAIGIIAAGLLEYGTLKQLSIGGLFGVGAIEESAKLIVPVALYISARYRSKADGLVLGVASGMGFAALETMGYGLTALIQSHGGVGALEQTILVRGLLSPVGHAAWTGLVCGALWRTRLQTGKSFNIAVVGVFLVAVVLHASWDIVGLSNNAVISYGGYVVVGGVSLYLLIWMIRRTDAPRRDSASA